MMRGLGGGGFGVVVEEVEEVGGVGTPLWRDGS